MGKTLHNYTESEYKSQNSVRNADNRRADGRKERVAAVVDRRVQIVTAAVRQRFGRTHQPGHEPQKQARQADGYETDDDERQCGEPEHRHEQHDTMRRAEHRKEQQRAHQPVCKPVPRAGADDGKRCGRGQQAQQHVRKDVDPAAYVQENEKIAVGNAGA